MVDDGVYLGFGFKEKKNFRSILRAKLIVMTFSVLIYLKYALLLRPSLMRVHLKILEEFGN